MLLKADLVGVTDTVNVLQSNCYSLKDYIVAQDTYSRRDNLLFDNVPDSKNVHSCVWCTCEKPKNDKRNVKQIRFVKCHKKGKPKKSGIRTIMSFDYFGDKEHVKK